MSASEKKRNHVTKTHDAVLRATSFQTEITSNLGGVDTLCL